MNPTPLPMTLPPLKLDCSLHIPLVSPTQQKLLLPSAECQLALLPSQQSNLMSPRVLLLFRSPSMQSLRMRTALAWQCEQLLLTWIWLDEWNKACLAQGMIPISWTTSQTLDHALVDVDQWSIATDTTLPNLRQYQHHKHPYLSDLQPHNSKAWPHFSSIVKTPQCWRLNSSVLSEKTMKMPLKYHQHTQLLKPLPKGWVYDEYTKAVKTKALTDPSLYELTCPCLMCTQQQLEDHCHRL